MIFMYFSIFTFIETHEEKTWFVAYVQISVHLAISASGTVQSLLITHIIITQIWIQGSHVLTLKFF